MKKKLLWFLVFLWGVGTSLQGFAQERTVSGKVTDASDGFSIPGVSVVLNGSTRGTITDVDGVYKISVQGDDSKLIFSFVGYQTQEITIGSRSIIDIQMEEDVKQLSEVIVTALGVQRQEATLGYAVSKVDGNSIVQAGNSNVMDAMNGRIAGVQIQNSGGQPGGGTSMIIRGYSSLNFSNQPLYVVDGQPINNDKQFGGTITGTPSANRAVDINPDDIESVSILKGGAATALYGIRAGNGAVIITTKKGNAAKKGLNIEYSFRQSFDKVSKLHETLNDYSRGRDGVYSNVTHWSYGPSYETNPTFPGAIGSETTQLDLDGDGTTEDVSGMFIPQYKDNYKNFWVDGATQRHNLNFSGQNDIASFYGSVSSLGQSGVVPNSEYHRYSFLANADFKVSDKVTYSAKVNYISTGGKRFRTAQGILAGLGYWHNMWDVNNYGWKNPQTGDKTWFSGGNPSPMWIVNEEGEDWDLNRWIGSMGIVYELSKWFTIDYRVGLDNYAEMRTEKRPFGSASTTGRLGDLTEIRLQNKDINSDLLIRGQGDLASKVDVNYLVGFNVFKTTYDGLSTTGSAFVLKNLYDITNTQSQTVSADQNGKLLVGVYGNISVGFQNMLYLDLTGRNDWSSTLPLDNNSFFYPSASLSFLLSEIWNPNWLSLLKFRASYSVMANDAPAQSLSDVFIKQDPNVWGRSRFTTSNSKNNPSIKPEKTNEIELGFDLRVFDNLLGLDFAWYNRTSTDQIILQPVPSPTGYDERLINLGEVSNKGIELMLSINDPIKIPGLRWTTGFTFTKNVGKVVRIGSADIERLTIASGWWTNVDMLAVEGQPYGGLYGYPWTRYGDLDYSDEGYLDQPMLIGANGLPSAGEEKVLLGNVNPDWILGISSDASFKGFKLGFTLERKQGGDVVNGLETNFVYSGLSTRTKDRYYAGSTVSNATHVFEGVLADGTPNTNPGQLTTTYYNGTYAYTDEPFVEDASWWRLRNIYIGYSLPKSLISKLSLTNVEITFTARNPWLSTKYTGNDPELSAHGAGNVQGFDELTTPGTKSYEVGFKIGF